MTCQNFTFDSKHSKKYRSVIFLVKNLTYLSIYPPCCNSLILLLFQSSSLGFKSMLFIIQATLWPAGL